MRHFFIQPEQIGQAEAVLTAQDARHIHTVLRLGPGALITLFDGRGGRWKARLISVDRRQVRVALVERLAAGAESPLSVVLAQGYLKDRKMDELIAPLTELGVHRFVPFLAHRSVPAPDPRRSQARVQRWQRISREAVKQCRRDRPMQIDPPLAFQEALALGGSCERKFFFYEGGGAVLSPPEPQSTTRSVFLMIGPEGGFEAGEQQAAAAAGFETLGLGPRILRAETAALAACTLIQHLFGDLS